MTGAKARRTLLRALAAAAVCLLPAAQAASAPPESAARPITLVVPYTRDGPTDRVTRPFALALARELGQPVDVAFVPGDGSRKGARAVLDSGGDDGHVLLVHNLGIASAVTMYRRLGFDPVKDFRPIARFADAPLVVLGRTGLGPGTAAQLWDHVRRNRARLTLAYGGAGSSGQLCALLLQQALGVQLFSVPYAGTGPALKDVAAGRGDLICDQTSNALEPLRAGTVIGYSVTTPERLEILPDLPTTAETGMPALQMTSWHGLWATRGTSAATIERLSAAARRAVASPGFIAAMHSLGVIPARPEQATPQSLHNLLVGEIARWRPVISAAGLFAD